MCSVESQFTISFEDDTALVDLFNSYSEYQLNTKEARSPLFYNIFTNDFWNSVESQFTISLEDDTALFTIKFADDTVLVDLINSEYQLNTKDAISSSLYNIFTNDCWSSVKSQFTISLEDSARGPDQL
nr:hypothetical protein BaRGS_007759 [Batillaria attramentaria]